MSVPAVAENGAQPANHTADGSNGILAPNPWSLSQPSVSSSSQSAPQFRLLTRPGSVASKAAEVSPPTAESAAQQHEPQTSHTLPPITTTASSGTMSSDIDTAGSSAVLQTNSTDPIDLHEFFVTTLQMPKDRIFLLRAEQYLVDFVADPEKSSVRFRIATSYHRMLVHRLAAYFGMDHNSDTDKAIIVSKTPTTQLPKQRFTEHLPAEDESTPVNVPPRAILRRVVREKSRSPDPCGVATNEVKENKTIEEREAEYEERRARIFNQPSGGSTLTSSFPERSSSQQGRPSKEGTTRNGESLDLQDLEANAQPSPGVQRQTSAPAVCSSPRNQTSQASGGRRFSGPSHLLATPTSSKLSGQPVWREESEFLLTRGLAPKESPEVIEGSRPLLQTGRNRDQRQGADRSSNWTQAGPGVLVEQGGGGGRGGGGGGGRGGGRRGDSVQESQLASQVNQISLGRGRGGVGMRVPVVNAEFMAYASRFPTSSGARNPMGVYPHIPSMMIPMHGRMAMLSSAARLHGPREPSMHWPTSVPVTAMGGSRQWMAQVPAPLLPLPTPWSPGMSNQPMSNLPVVLEVYNLPANLRNYETDILLDDLKKLGASLQYTDHTVFAVFRVPANACTALEHSFSHFKVRLAPPECIALLQL